MREHVYADFDEYVADIRDADAVVMLQKVDQPVWNLTRLVLPGVHIQKGRPGSGNVMQGQTSVDGYVVYLPVSSGCEYRANGVSYGRGSAVILEPGAEFCLSTRAAHEWYAVLVSTPLALDGDVSRRSVGPRRPTCRVVSTARPLANQLETLVRDVTVAATRCDSFETSAAAKRAAGAAANIARSLIGIPRAGEPLQQGRPRISRRDIIRSCVEWLEGRSKEPFRVSELAAGVDVSERTLRTAFNEYFGVNPTRYLELRRLHAVRRALRAAGPDKTTVTDILARHGELAFGRFATRYRRLFGERPSETLAGRLRDRPAIPASRGASPGSTLTIPMPGATDPIPRLQASAG